MNLSNGPFFSGSSEGSSEGILIQGETATYIAFYIIQDNDITSGRIINTVEASATGPNQETPITDISDDGDDTDGNTIDDPTVIMLQEVPSIEVIKTASVDNNNDDLIDTGDMISFEISVENTGNTILTNLELVDSMTDGNGNALSLSNGPFFTGSTLGSLEGDLKIGESATYIAFYTIEQSTSDSGKIINTVMATAENMDGSITVSDVSDDGDDTDGNTQDDPTEVLISPNPLIEVTKTATTTIRDDGIAMEGDVIVFTIVVENKGNVKIDDLLIEDFMVNGDGTTIYLSTDPKLVSATSGSTANLIAPGGILVFRASYSITQSDIISGEILNSVRVAGTALNYEGEVFDYSDDGEDEDDNTVDDPTEIELNGDYVQKIEIFELVTPNDDRKNDYFIITGIEDYPNNILQIYNRWGVLVFEVEGYPGGGNSEAFRGFSNGRVTISKDEKLPSGTYYYVLSFPGADNPGKKVYIGDLYLQND